jgi:4'-phosphopantetheinyl transferase
VTSLAPLDGSIACWRLRLDPPDEVVTALLAPLAPDERERAGRFAFARDRRRFVVTRAALRVLLAESCHLGPADVRLVYGAHGKPALAPGTPGPTVHFNVSHSQDLALLALGGDGPLGVDVEALRPLRDRAAIADRFFTPAEASVIASLPDPEQDLAFFLCWTRKEAVLKAVGDGISLGLDRYQVACRPGEPARVLEVDGRADLAAEWTMIDLRVAPGFAGALALRGSAPPFHLDWLDLAREVLPRLSP